ncbi:MAG TPA: hypothetical protein VHT97_01570 [Acidimicrobiales bacterium]|nr:hypothetical protein [Acidimicrobiales bacterium]
MVRSERAAVVAPPIVGEPPGAPYLEPEPEPERGRPAPPWQWWFPVVAFIGVAAVVIAVSVLAHAELPLLHHRHRQLQRRGWLGAFSWWDGWWYVDIARRGYLSFHGADRQSSVAFFPLYPLAMRELGRVVGGPLVAGFALSVASGLGAVVLLHRWCVDKFGPAQARLAVGLLVVYPFAFYLMGAVYADALFLAAALGAFVAFEHDRPVLAGLAAALATAARPVGVAVIAGLWVLALERKGVLAHLRGGGGRSWSELARRWRAADAGLLAAPVGLGAFCVFLWIRFDRPFAFLDTAGAPGWDQPPGFHTWFKVHFFKAVLHGPWLGGHVGHLVANFAATVVMAAFIPAVFRKLGVGYGVFVVVAVVATAVSTKDFVGMGRYTLAAFPCFAVAADALYRRPWLARAVLGLSAAGLVLLAELHARGTIVS